MTSWRLPAAILVKDQSIVREEGCGQWACSKPTLIAKSEEGYLAKFLLNFGSWEEQHLERLL